MGHLLQGLALLTEVQKRDLKDAGVTAQLRTDWKAGRRLPTEAQAVIFAGVAGVDLLKLQAEIALARSTDAQRPLVERYLKRVHGALVTLAYGFGVGAALVASHGDSFQTATMYKRDRREGDRRMSH